MLPLHLRIRNFLSYGEPPAELDYGSFRIACVTGENGHGKSSAVVDAVTFALWGQARGTDARGAGVDDLIRLGADEMEVEFSFELESSVYRVIRKRARGRSTVLEFHVRDGASWRALTAERIPETQERINRVLRLDYTTFVHSAFVLQGRADAFTVAKPGDRKQILAEVLGLAEYEEREARCRERFQGLSRQVEALDRELADLAAQTADLPATKAALVEVEAAMTRLGTILTAAREELAAAEARRNQLEQIRVRVEEMRRRIAGYRQELADLAGAKSALEERMAESHAVCERSAEIERGFRAWEEVRKAVEQFSAKARLHYSLASRRDQIRAALEAETRRLREQIERLRADEARETLRAAGLQEALRRRTEYQEALSRLEAVRVAQQRLVERGAGLQEELARKRADLAARQKELDSLRERFRQVKDSLDEPCCPVCRSPLDEDRRRALLEGIKEQGLACANEAALLQKAIDDHEGRLRHCQQELAGLQRELAAEAQLAAGLANADRDAEEAAAAAERAAAAAAQAAALEAELSTGSYASAIRRDLAAAEAELAALGYDEAAHQLAMQEEGALRHFQEELAKLNLARQALAKDRELLLSYEQRMGALRQALNSEEASLAILEDQVSGLPNARREAETAREHVKVLEDEERTLLGKRAGVLGRLETLEALEARRRSKEEERAAAVREKAYWSELAQAYGKKGIQALIIENAIPELEQEANELLARWSEGRLHVALITQVETRSGSVAETLDIAIADELGTRKYEMFSGGEKFRIDLALRIGLSKLLAKRAGARLRMLVIDEGFGTQDASGLERLVEALNDLSSEFDKILVITHHPQLKDRFPTHIEVVKRPDLGSQIRIAS